MKQFFIAIFILSCFAAKADWVEGIVTYTDGKTEAGYLRFFNDPNSLSLKFKSEINGKIISIESSQVLQVQMEVNNGDLVIAKYLKLSEVNLGDEFKLSKTKMWYNVIYRGDFDIVVPYCDYTNTSNYFICWPDQDFATLIILSGDSRQFAIGQKSMLKKSINEIFKGKCDYIVECVNNNTFMPAEPQELIYFYKSNCGSQKVITTL